MYISETLKEITMSRTEFRSIIWTAYQNINKLESVGIKLNNSEKNIIKGILYLLHYGTL